MALNTIGVNFKAVGATALRGHMNSVGMSAIKMGAAFSAFSAIIDITIQKFQELIKWGLESAEKFRAFEKSMTEVSTLLSGEANTAILGLTAGVEELSKQYGKSANDLAEGTYQIISAAIETKDAMNLLNTATRASIAGLTDVATSVDVFTSIINAYGMSVYQASEISDMLFQTIIRGKLRFEDLASAMGYIVPISSNLSIAFEEVAAALSTVTRQGLHVDMATRGLALGMQNIANPTEQASVAARKYDVMMNSLVLSVKGLEYFINDLADATKIYGKQIIPEMIRNMRSLRVMMALVGEEGIAGFTKDLELLEKATGRTEEALSKMMSTTQREVEMLNEAMNQLQRDIGSAWSDIDIWWKKAGLWWGTFISSFDLGKAGKAVTDYEDRIYETAVATYELAKAEKIYSKQSSLYDRLTETGKISGIDWKKMKQYFDFQTQLEQTEELNANILLAKQYIKTTPYDEGLWGKNVDKRFNVTQWKERIVEEFGSDLANDINKELTQELRKIEPDLSGGIWGFEYNIYTTTQVKKALSNVMNDLKTDAANLKINIDSLGFKFEDYASAIATTTQKINEHSSNILQLKNEIILLEREVEKTYTTLGGHEFEGKMDQQISTFKEDILFSRMQTYTQYASKYGVEYADIYINSIKEELDRQREEYAVGSVGLSEMFPDPKVPTIDQDLVDLVSDYDENLRENISTISEWDLKIKDHDNNIAMYKNQLADYESQVASIREEEEKRKNILDKLSLSMNKLSLAMMKIRIKGMKRRRGLTRGEEREITRLRIKQMQENIEKAEQDIYFSEHPLQKIPQAPKAPEPIDLEVLKNAEYNIKKFFDQWQLKIFEMNDIRNDELNDMVEDYNYQKGTLSTYRKWLADEYEKIGEEHTKYLLLLEEVDPEIKNRFEDTFGIKIPEEINKTKKAIEETKKEYIDFINTLSGNNKNKVVTNVSNVIENTPSTNMMKLSDFTQITGHQRGTHHVPYTGLHMLHKGEQVVPRGTDRQPGNIIVNITTNVENIGNDVDINNIARANARIVSAELKDRYRMR